MRSCHFKLCLPDRVVFIICLILHHSTVILGIVRAIWFLLEPKLFKKILLTKKKDSRLVVGGPGGIHTVFGARIGYRNYTGSCLGRFGPATWLAHVLDRTATDVNQCTMNCITMRLASHCIIQLYLILAEFFLLTTQLIHVLFSARYLIRTNYKSVFESLIYLCQVYLL